MGEYLIDLAFTDIIPNLIAKYPQDLAEDAIRLIENIADQETIVWRLSSIEESDQNSGENLGVYLVRIIRDALLCLTDQNKEIVKKYLNELLGNSNTILIRIAIYVIGVKSKILPDLTEMLFQERKFINEITFYHEYWHFIEKTFIDQTFENREKFLNYLIENFNKERQDQYLLFHWLWPIKDQLLGERITIVDNLTQKFGELDRPDFLSYHFNSGGPLSPAEKEDLFSMSKGEIKGLLHKPLPVMGYGEPAQEGFVSVLQEAVKEKPEKFLILADDFDPTKIPPIYVYYFIQGLSDGWKSGKEFSWDIALDYIRKLIGLRDDELFIKPQADSWHSFSTRDLRRSILFLLSAGIRTKNHKIQASYFLQVRELLIELFSDFDINKDEKERIKEFPSGIITLALNHDRAIALDTLINYELLYARVHFGKKSDVTNKMEKDVEELLSFVLNENESLTVHSIFGKYFPNFLYLNKDWAIANIDNIFPDERGKRDRFVSAWGSYLYRGDFFNNSFELLRGKYEIGIILLEGHDDFGTGLKEIIHRIYYHLYFAFWRDLETLFGEESLIQQFLKLADPQDITNFVTGLGSGLKTVKPPKESSQWKELKEFWYQRFSLKKLHSIEGEDGEMVAFLSWVPNFPEELHTFIDDIKYAAVHSNFHSIFKLLDFLQQDIKHVSLSVDVLNSTLQNIIEPWRLYRKDEVINQILTNAMRENGQTREMAIEAINRLGELGHEQYRYLLDL